MDSVRQSDGVCEAPGGKSLFGRPLSEEGCWGGGCNTREPEDRDEVGGRAAVDEIQGTRGVDGWGVRNPRSQPEMEGPREERAAGGGDPAPHS